MQSSAIFPLFYLPPVGYFSALKAHDFNFVLEKQEHFPKQTYRNRASIASPDGTLDLIIPVVKGAKVHTALKDVKISYDTRWQRLHWLSLQNCYRSSAYFEFYEDGLRPFYERKFDFLYDYNLELLQWLCKQLKIEAAITESQSYEKEWPGLIDYRNRMSKKEVPLQETKSYFQVFSDRNEFMPNLSMVDLLFSQGPQSKTYF
ncbi:WbqC family protein [Pedobacter sp. ASV12]|uniref:WbqC family protein n=1 Tax=Pedobacter sp. ASV12 TaxID=2795120 RepID=UPI0018ED647F|nr:WbqC family protein [Pedobacter sp. ASV12]